MQMESLAASHLQRTMAQPVSESCCCFGGKAAYPLSLLFPVSNAKHDIIWCGISFWLVWVSSAPSQLLACAQATLWRHSVGGKQKP